MTKNFSDRMSGARDDRPGCVDGLRHGTRFGRPQKVVDTDHIAIARRMKSDGHTGKAIAKYLGASRAALCRYSAKGQFRIPLNGHGHYTTLPWDWYATGPRSLMSSLRTQVARLHRQLVQQTRLIPPGISR